MAKDEKKKKGGCLKPLAIGFAILLALGSCTAVLGEDSGSSSTPKNVTIEDLTELRDEVLEIQEYDVAAGTYQPILDAINGAQNVLYRTDNPTDEQIAAAYDALAAARDGAVMIEDAEKTAENAALMARKYTAGDSSYSEFMVIMNLVSMDGYDEAVATEGVKASGVDWDEEAFQYAMNKIERNSKMTVAELIADMSKMYYTEDNIAYALVQAGIAS